MMLAILIILLVLVFLAVILYNRLVKLRNNREKAFADIELKASQNFIQLQEEIADIENKLAAARRFFNSATKELNNAVETFPSNLLAGMFGFKREPMFDLGPEQRVK